MAGISTLGSAQHELILTEEDKVAWIKKMNEERDLAKRLEILRIRILVDTMFM